MVFLITSEMWWTDPARVQKVLHRPTDHVIWDVEKPPRQGFRYPQVRIVLVLQLNLIQLVTLQCSILPGIWDSVKKECWEIKMLIVT